MDFGLGLGLGLWQMSISIWSLGWVWNGIDVREARNLNKVTVGPDAEKTTASWWPSEDDERNGGWQRKGTGKLLADPVSETVGQ